MGYVILYATVIIDNVFTRLCFNRNFLFLLAQVNAYICCRALYVVSAENYFSKDTIFEGTGVVEALSCLF